VDSRIEDVQVVVPSESPGDVGLLMASEGGRDELARFDATKNASV